MLIIIIFIIIIFLRFFYEFSTIFLRFWAIFLRVWPSSVFLPVQPGFRSQLVKSYDFASWLAILTTLSVTRKLATGSKAGLFLVFRPVLRSTSNPRNSTRYSSLKGKFYTTSPMQLIEGRHVGSNFRENAYLIQYPCRVCALYASSPPPFSQPKLHFKTLTSMNTSRWFGK